MKDLPIRHRVVLIALFLAAIGLFLVIVDFGVNAGRIHHGVRVGDVHVGGLIESEAADVLREVGHQMREQPIAFTAEGLNFNFTAEEFGWLPKERVAVRRARSVGRDGGVVTILRDRARAWWSGVSVAWPGRLDNEQVRPRMKTLARQAKALGYTLYRGEMRRRIRRAIEEWPRRPYYEIPVTRE